MTEYRCKNCDKVLLEGDFVGVVKKRCPKCKEWNFFYGKYKNKYEKICDSNN